MKITKGNHGYIRTRKKAQLYKTLAMFGIAAAIFVFGLAINKWEKSNVFTIVAALAVLPAAKMLVNFIVLVPYHSVPEKEYERLIAATQKEDVIFSDIVYTSEKCVMNLAILVIAGNHLIGLTGRKKENRGYMEQYLKKEFEVRGFHASVKIYEEEAQFLRQMKQVTRETLAEKEITEWKEYLLSLMV